MPPDKPPPETEQVLAANLAYYQALSARDLRAMEKIWTCAPDNILIAPPVDPVTYVGWPAIRQNWERYWAQFDELRVAMASPVVNVNGPVAWVHGIETSRRRAKSGAVSKSSNYGTNIFVKHDSGWRMVFHQAALISDRDG